jgi:hypothetical protein
MTKEAGKLMLSVKNDCSCRQVPSALQHLVMILSDVSHEKDTHAAVEKSMIFKVPAFQT